MIISTKKGTPQVELDRIVDNFEKQGLSVTLIRGTDYNVFGLVGDTTKIAEKDVLANPWVENVTRVSAPYKRANRLFHPEDTVVDINGVKVGGNAPIAVMAGPCSIEGEEHTIKMAKAVKAGGANFLRGGPAGRKNHRGGPLRDHQGARDGGRFCDGDTPGFLQRERLHTAVHDPAVQPDGPEGALYRRGAAV